MNPKNQPQDQEPKAAQAAELSDQELDEVSGGYQAWFTCLKSCADSKGQVQGELARFR
jgi:hypothetical protein